MKKKTTAVTKDNAMAFGNIYVLQVYVYEKMMININHKD